MSGLLVGQVQKLLNISRETLRYFEKKKIVVARKSDNNYRYYDDWDINYLIEYKKFRSYDFNVNQSKEILHEDSLEDLQKKFGENNKRLEEQIKRYNLLLEKGIQYEKELERIEEKIDSYSLVDMESFYYFKIRYNNDYLCDSDTTSLFSSWSEEFPLVDPILVINKAYDKNYECALSIPEKYQQKLRLPMNHLVRKIEKGKALNFVIVAGDKNTFTTDLLMPAYQYIEQNGYMMNGPVIGYYQARVHEKGGYKRYIEIVIPIVKKSA